MFILRHIASRHITQWWVGVHYPRIHQSLQRYQVLVEACILDPAPAERQCRVVVVDVGEEGTGFAIPDWYFSGIEVFHVVRAVYIVVDVASNKFKHIRAYFPVEPNVSIAYTSPSSIFSAFPPFTIGTLFPACI